MSGDGVLGAEFAGAEDVRTRIKVGQSVRIREIKYDGPGLRKEVVVRTVSGVVEAVYPASLRDQCTYVDIEGLSRNFGFGPDRPDRDQHWYRTITILAHAPDPQPVEHEYTFRTKYDLRERTVKARSLEEATETAREKALASPRPPFTVEIYKIDGEPA